MGHIPSIAHSPWEFWPKQIKFTKILIQQDTSSELLFDSDNSPLLINLKTLILSLSAYRHDFIKINEKKWLFLGCILSQRVEKNKILAQNV